MTRICAGIVTFEPDMNKLQKNIEALLSQVEEVLVFDNGSVNVDGIQTLIQNYDNKVSLLQSLKNKGIAKALNELCQWGLDKGYPWIVTMDQDSQAPADMVAILSEYAGEEQTAVISPDLCYRGNEQFALTREVPFENVEWTITSGSLTKLSVWKHMGGFDEELFIDYVDYDYCKRVNQEGYVVKKVYKTILLHELGNLRCKRVLGRTVYITNHSPKRRYYMMRNAWIMYKRYKEKTFLLRIVKLYCKTIVFEDKKWQGLLLLNRGFADGIRYKVRD